jgi:hypothetical protein
MEILLAFLKNKLAICSWWCTESGDGIFVQVIEETGPAEGATVVMNEEARSTIPRSEERPGCFCPSYLRFLASEKYLEFEKYHLVRINSSTTFRATVEANAFQ